MKKFLALVVAAAMTLNFCACNENTDSVSSSVQDSSRQLKDVIIVDGERYRLIEGGSFTMGSPDSESWRGEDETAHDVTVGDFYISKYEVTQEEYSRLMGENPSTFSGENLPVENVSWYDALLYCNAKSEAEGLEPAYIIDGNQVIWNQNSDGWRLPTEAEWEYACRAGTTTPFNTENSPSRDEVNYYGHYPYEIEGNYFNQSRLETQPGLYR